MAPSPIILPSFAAFDVRALPQSDNGAICGNVNPLTCFVCMCFIYLFLFIHFSSTYHSKSLRPFSSLLFSLFFPLFTSLLLPSLCSSPLLSYLPLSFLFLSSPDYTSLHLSLLTLPFPLLSSSSPHLYSPLSSSLISLLTIFLPFRPLPSLPISSPLIPYLPLPSHLSSHPLPSPPLPFHLLSSLQFSLLSSRRLILT